MRRLISLLVLIALVVGPVHATQAQVAAPVISTIAPPFIQAGGSAASLTVYGANFVSSTTLPPGSILRYNDPDPMTGFVDKLTDNSKAESATPRLFGLLTDSDIACPGVAKVQVRNPNGDLSNVVDLLLLNNAPTAGADSASTPEDIPVTVDVLANDTPNDPETCDGLQIVAVGAAANGRAAQVNNQIVYTPAAEFSGTDAFTYTVKDNFNGVATARVAITITFVNDPPRAVDDPGYSTAEDTRLTANVPTVLANDSDPENDPLTARLNTPTSNGTLVLNANGTFVYTPTLNFNGVDTFTYTASDGTSRSNSATVTITVTPVNDPPIAVNDSYSTAEDTTLTVTTANGVLKNDRDVDGDSLSVSLLSNVTHGTLTLNADGSFTYTPEANYSGSDGFSYTVSDGQGGSAVGSVTITVNPVNDPPIAVNDSYSTAEDTTLNVSAVNGVLKNDRDPDSVSLTAQIATTTTNGSLTLNPDGSFTYAPTTNFNGVDTFTYTASDGTSLSSSATVTIIVTAVNDPPVAVNDSYSTVEDTTLTVPVASGVLANDRDVDGDSLSATLLSNVANGTLTFRVDGSFIYTPTLNFNGQDGFTYTVSDGKGGSAVGTVTITVTAAPDLPVAGADSYSTNEDTTLIVTAAIGVLKNDSDPDGPISLVGNTTTSNGSLTLNPDGSLTYMPNSDYFGADSFTYTIQDTDGNQATANVSITINPVNDQPSFSSGASGATVLEDAPTPTVAGWASAPSVGPANEAGQTFSYVVSTSNAGTFTGTPDVDEATGDLSYTLAPNANGVFTITVRLQDSGGTANGGVNTSTPHTYQVTVTAVNDEPSFTAGANQTVNEDSGARTVPNWASSISRGAANESTQLIVFNVSVDAPSLFSVQPSINTAGTLTYTPAANAYGVANVTVTLQDNGGTAHGGDDTSPTANFTISINAVNDAPSFTAVGNQTVNEDSGARSVPSWATSLSTGPANESGQSFLGFIVTNTNNALFSVQPAVSLAGTLTFTPAPNANGSATVTVRLQDNGGTANGGQDTSTAHIFTITVSPVNDAPTANDDSYTMSENTTTNQAPNPLNVLLNDSILPDSGETLTVTLVSQPANGTATVVNSATHIAYVPNRSYVGLDTFIYQACDVGGLCDLATVTLNITERFTPTYVPLVRLDKAPDLVVQVQLTPEKANYTAGEPVVIAVILTNNGTLTSTGTIWVDAYINPTPVPQVVGQTWDVLGCTLTICQGLAWKVSQPLAPGQRITLTSNPGKYDAARSRWYGSFVAGTNNVYAFADVWNPLDPAGAVKELEEDNNSGRWFRFTVTGTTTAFANRPQTAIAPRSER